MNINKRGGMEWIEMKEGERDELNKKRGFLGIVRTKLLKNVI